MSIVMIIILLAVCILLPIYYSVRVFRLSESSKAGWLIMVVEAGVIVSLVLVVGRWDIAGYYTRFVLLTLLLAAVAWSFHPHWSRPWRPAAGFWRRYRGTALSLALFTAALLYVVSGMVPPSGAQPLEFPLKDGRFVVAQGGGVPLLNHHAGHPEQRFATDITAIYPNGFRARGLLPDELENYAIFGAPVVSPCAGEVVAARDDLPDLIPPERDRENVRGNHVILTCGDLNVELAHFMQDSVSVATGDRVAVGDPLGRVGNSGNTTEPHLHVHAVDPGTGLGVPMTFDGRYPVRNSVFQ